MRLDLKSHRVRIAMSVVVSLLAIFALSRLRVKMPQHDENPAPSATDVPGVEIYEGVSVTQEFRAQADNVTSVSLMLATYRRENPGTLTITVSKRDGEDWLPLTTASLEKRLLVDNANQIFSFPRPLKVTKGDELALTLTADGPSSSAITWRVYSELNLPDHRLLVGDQVTPGTAVFRVWYRGAVGRLGGPRMRGRLWQRITVFLNTPGQVLLATGFLLALFGFSCAMFTPSERASQPEARAGDRD